MNKNKSILLIITIILLAILACYYEPNKNDSKKTNVTKKVDDSFITDAILESEDEKITLLSILKNTSKDSITLIMRDYLLNTENDSIPYKQIINTIAQKYDIPNRKVASIIFSYKYEMLTKEDIEEAFIESNTPPHDY